MKLLHKLLVYLLLVAVPVALGGTWLLHSLIQKGVRYEVDEQLSSDFLYVSRQLQQTGYDVDRVNNPRIRITPTNTAMPVTYSDTVGFDIREKETEPIRRLTATVQLAGRQTYRVTIDQPMGELGEIIDLLSGSVTIAFVLLLVVLILLNGWVVRRLWQPFYRLIEQLRQYRLEIRPASVQMIDTRSGKTPPTMAFAPSDVAEFNQLSEALNTMSRNVYTQFMAQREFTDNAAHEMQTPLTITGHELENLLATEPLTNEQIQAVERAQDSIRRLARLNKSLLLLTRIENNQFVGEAIDLSRLVRELTGVYEDFARHHALAWHCQIEPAVTQTMNPYLAEVLFSNLLQNAVRHSRSGTVVTIRLTAAYFEIENSGSALPFPAERLFDRFVKDPAQPESTGLGLALVQQIARLYGMMAHYEYEAESNSHRFQILFARTAS